LVKSESKDFLLFNGRWAGLQAYRQSNMFIIGGTMIRLITEVLMAIHTRGDKKEGRNILIYNGPITTISSK